MTLTKKNGSETIHIDLMVNDQVSCFDLKASLAHSSTTQAVLDHCWLHTIPCMPCYVATA